MFKKNILLAFFVVAFFGFGFAQHTGIKKTTRSIKSVRANAVKVQKMNMATQWVDSAMKDMTLRQQVAQLMVIRVPLNLEGKSQREFEQVLRETEVGGVCFFVGTAKHTLPLIKRFQSLSKVPLLVCIDAEWGLGMRLSDCYSFPKNADWGLLPREMDGLLYDMGAEIGRQCRNMGIHVNFAPVVDVNSNPDNPVIGPRSFSADPKRVAELGIQYMKGLQSQGVIAVAKHFPGHGDTKTDSHFDLPIINHTRQYMDTVDLYPFQRLIDEGVEGVMTAHLQVNAYEKEPNHPSSLSAHLVSELLRQRMKFNGMVITDGLDMQGVTKYYKDGDGELAALLAGTDILLLPPSVPKAISRICQAAEEDPALRQLVEMRCRRVLRSKYLHGCSQLRPNEWHVPTVEDSLRCDAIVRSLTAATNGKIDSIVNDGIANKAYPGCQVLAIKDGRVLYRKAFGRQTYDPLSPAVDMNTVYDLASVTKMLSTTLAMMKLVETGKVKLDDPLSRYLPYLKHTDKEKITIRQALSHMARLKSFYPYWKEAQDADDPRASVLQQVTNTHLLSNTEYVYSDLGFILMGDLIQTVSGQRLDIFVNRHFYSPMGLCHTFYNPMDHGIDSLTIAPTEYDDHYRMLLVQGVVHDENAYVMGGISGHAGLFSNADDVARILQMLLDGGVYDGKRYLKAETIALFNTRHYSAQGCRRGLGFDKPLISGHGGSACPEASPVSYGHTGFTGTMVWVDPDCGMIYIFLSNRVHPNATPNKLANMNIRTKIQSELYKAVKDMHSTKQGAGTAKFGY
ncbi:MAG: serine hydrolase [Bacteroidales bacterium]|nr:serine hydrolase [Bacteroidales bacterium]